MNGRAPASPEFREFFMRSYSDMFARARMMCRHRQDAEDAVQEAYTEAFARWDRLKHYDSPEAWIYKIIIQRVSATWRRLGRLRPMGVEPLQLSATSAEHAIQARAVLSALAMLPSRQRQVIVMHCLDGWTQVEIARELGISRGAVAASIYKGRDALRRALGMIDRAEDTLVAGVSSDGDAFLYIQLPRAMRVAHQWLRAGAESDRQTLERIFTEATAHAPEDCTSD